MPSGRQGGELPKVSQPPGDEAFYGDPYPFYAARRAAGRCFFWQEYGHACVTRYDDVNRLLRDRRFGRHIDPALLDAEPNASPRLRPFRRFERHSLLELEPPEHTRLRRLVNRAFVSSQVERLRAPLTELAHRLIDSMPGGGPADLLPAYAEPIPLQTIARLLGVPVEMGPQLLDWSHRMVAMYQHNRDAAVEDAAVAATVEFSDYVRDEIARRQREPGDDLLSRLVELRRDGARLDTDEIVSTTILLLNAGHEATVHAIGNSVRQLLDAPLAPATLFGDAATAAAAVDELLRFDPPLHLFTRYALEDVEFAGTRLAAGELVGAMLASANRDEARYARAHRLDFERGGGGQLGFGAGIHFCVGAPLARLEVEVALEVLFQRLPGLALAAVPRHADRYHFHGYETLPVCW